MMEEAEEEEEVEEEDEEEEEEEEEEKEEEEADCVMVLRRSPQGRPALRGGSATCLDSRSGSCRSERTSILLFPYLFHPYLIHLPSSAHLPLRPAPFPLPQPP